MDILAYLVSQLRKERQASLKGLGTFYKEKEPGRYDLHSQSYLPPKYFLTFDSNTQNDEVFEEGISQENSVSGNTAAYYIEQFVSGIWQKLSSGSPYHLQGIGTLYEQNGQIRFNPDEGANLGQDFFGLLPVQEPVLSHIPVPSGDQDLQEKPDLQDQKRPLPAGDQDSQDKSDLQDSGHLNTGFNRALPNEKDDALLLSESDEKQEEQDLQDTSDLQDAEDSQTGINNSLFSGNQDLQDKPDAQDSNDPQTGLNNSLASGNQDSQDKPDLQDSNDPQTGLNNSLASGNQDSQDKPDLQDSNDPQTGLNNSLASGNQDLQDTSDLQDAEDSQTGINNSLSSGNQDSQDKPDLQDSNDPQTGLNNSLASGNQDSKDKPDLQVSNNTQIGLNSSVSTGETRGGPEEAEVHSEPEIYEEESSRPSYLKWIILLFVAVIIIAVALMARPSLYTDIFGKKDQDTSRAFDKNVLKTTTDTLTGDTSLINKVNAAIGPHSTKIAVLPDSSSYEIVVTAVKSTAEVNRLIARYNKMGFAGKVIPGKMLKKISVASFTSESAARDSLEAVRKKLKNKEIYIYYNNRK